MIFETIRMILCCYFLAQSGATVYRIAIWLILGEPASAAYWLVSLVFYAIILHAFFREECREILNALKKTEMTSCRSGGIWQTRRSQKPACAGSNPAFGTMQVWRNSARAMTDRDIAKR